jgi:hypothetical protein
MTRLSRIAAAALLVVLLALGVAACGDDDTNSPSAEVEVEEKKSDRDGDFEPVPLRVSGGGSAQFRVQGGDNSVVDFGEEAGESDLEEAAEAVHGFYVARAEGDWPTACAHFSEALLKQLEGLAAKSERESCASFLESFTTRQSDAAWRKTTVVDAVSLREGDAKAFLIYRGAAGQVYAALLSEEGGEWKLASLSASTLG